MGNDATQNGIKSKWKDIEMVCADKSSVNMRKKAGEVGGGGGGTKSRVITGREFFFKVLF